MIVAECECGNDVPFPIDGTETSATTVCNGCGRVYRLKVTMIQDAE